MENMMGGGGAGYSSSVTDTGANTSGITNNLGGGINAPAINKGPSPWVLIGGAVVLIVVAVIFAKVRG